MIYILIALTISSLINTYIFIEYSEALTSKAWNAGMVAMFLSIFCLGTLWIEYFK